MQISTLKYFTSNELLIWTTDDFFDDCKVVAQRNSKASHLL